MGRWDYRHLAWPISRRLDTERWKRGDRNVGDTNQVAHRSGPLSNLDGKGTLGAYAMKRLTAGAHLPASWLFERNAQIIELSTAWAAVSSSRANTILFLTVE